MHSRRTGLALQRLCRSGFDTHLRPAYIGHTRQLEGPSCPQFQKPRESFCAQQYPWTHQRLKSRIVAVAVATATTSPDSSTSSPDMKAKSLPLLTTRPRPMRRPGLAGRRNWM